MGKAVAIENIAEMRLRAGIDDVELRRSTVDQTPLPLVDQDVGDDGCPRQWPRISGFLS
jgi:hypothetical protein